MDASDLTVIACPDPVRPAALRHLHDGLPSDQQSALVEALERTDAGDAAAWDGLLVAARNFGRPASEFVGATWVQRIPGNTAVVWPPAADCPAADMLLHTAAQWCDERAIPLAQLSVKDQDVYCREQFEGCGFARLAELLYLYMDAKPGPKGSRPAASEVEFLARAGFEPRRLSALIEQTYIGTQDCPALDGVRTMPDVLAGYYAQGRHLPEHWYFVQIRGEDVGALILADHSAAGNCELVYMGVIPAVRGGGVGEIIIRHALAATAELGARRLVLAVDASNQPALTLYRRAGFTEWDRRTIYAHFVRRTT